MKRLWMPAGNALYKLFIIITTTTQVTINGQHLGSGGPSSIFFFLSVHVH